MYPPHQTLLSIKSHYWLVMKCGTGNLGQGDLQTHFPNVKSWTMKMKNNESLLFDHNNRI